MSDFNYNGNTARRPIRPAPSKYDQSRFNGRFEVSEGVRLAEIFYPWRYLPVLREDASTNDYIVMNKGTIVSAITNQNYISPLPGTLGVGEMVGPGISQTPIEFLMAAANTAQTFVHNLGNTDYTVVFYDGAGVAGTVIAESNANLTIVKGAMSVVVTYNGAAATDVVLVTPAGVSMQSFRDQVEDDGTMVYVDNREAISGLGDHVQGLLVPANGGTISCFNMSALDVTAGTFSYDETTGLATATTNHYVPANIPIGVAFQTMFQDIRGRYINYEQHGFYSVLTDWFVEVPYVNAAAYLDSFCATSGTTLTYVKDTSGGTYFDGAATTHAGYLAVNKTRQFMYFNAPVAALETPLQDEEAAVAGQYVMSDAYGHFIPQGTSESLTLTTAKTCQTVGKLVVTDNHFPKDSLQAVDTYPGSEVPGTETRGVPDHLYFFAKEALAAMGETYTPAAILTAIEAGYFGLARINLDIS